jgi:membrane protein DedA with SNARE-associated domain
VLHVDGHGAAAYFVILAAALVEGEIVFVASAALVSQGVLDPIGVAVAGALGAACGDQIPFYLLRGRLRRWLDRRPAIARRGAQLVRRVRRHETLTVLAIRFSPGLRLAIAAACAYAGVPPLKFSLLSVVSAMSWAVSLLVLVAWLGPAVFGRLGIPGWAAAAIPAVLVVLAVRWLSREEQRDLDEDADATVR